MFSSACPKALACALQKPSFATLWLTDGSEPEVEVPLVNFQRRHTLGPKALGGTAERRADSPTDCSEKLRGCQNCNAASQWRITACLTYGLFAYGT